MSRNSFFAKFLRFIGIVLMGAGLFFGAAMLRVSAYRLQVQKRSV